MRLVVDANTGAIAQRIDYDEFGRVTQDTNPGFQPFGYAGGLYDPDTQLVHFGARDYDAELGRWITKDPLLLGGGSNVYAYVGNDPINLTDISGLLAGVPDWLLWLDDHGVLQSAGDFSAGLSSALTFGLSDKLIDATGLGAYGSKCSGAYTIGRYTGVALGLAASVGGLAARGTVAGAARGARGAVRGINRLGGVVSSAENGAGGVVVTAEGSVQGADFAGHVNAGLMRGSGVDILSGVHGNAAGVMKADAAILAEDVAMFGGIEGVTVHDVASLSESTISGMLNGPGTTIGAFCNSGACLARYMRF